MNNKNAIMQDLLYMQALQPDDGYDVDFAVGTTFSLNMEGLVSVPLAFSNMGDAKKLSDNTAMYLMEGIRRASNKFVVFCNKGSIHVPSYCQPLYSLLEQTVIEVSDEKNPLANFHPKIWVIRQTPIYYKNEKRPHTAEAMIKLIITSRNLTFSNDLDAAIVIKGTIKKDVENKRNYPLARFINELAEKYVEDENKKKEIKKIAKDILCVKKFDFEEPFSSTVYELYPYMTNNNGNSTNFNTTSILERLQGKRILVFSPFIDSVPKNGILANIRKNTEKLYLVTRDNSVTEDIINMCDEVYTLSISMNDTEQAKIDLHAKMYIVEQTNNAVYMYLGSANATENAFHRNSELTIGMRVNNMNFDEIKDNLGVKENANDSLYIKVEEPLVNIEEERKNRQEKNDLEHIMRWAIARIDKANVIKHTKSEHSYEVTLSTIKVDTSIYRINQCVNNYQIMIRPLQCKNDWIEIKNKISWHLDLEDLSEFYVICVTNISKKESNMKRVCKIRTEGLQKHKELRNDSIINAIIKPNNIMQYIDMILSDFPEATFEKWNKRNTEQNKKYEHASISFKNISIYEQLLKASYENPQKIDDLKKILCKIPNNEDTKDFSSLLKAFGITLKRKKK